MRVETIEQYKAMQFIKENFYLDHIELELIDRYSIGITDKNNDRMIVSYKDDEIKVI